MAKKMLIDATQLEETRVAVIDGNRLDELDFEIASKKQLKGNIYLAKVTRVEPSLQAAFVDYGGNRHGFLAFAEIHPDYYRIPVADREKLIALEREEAEREDEEAERETDLTTTTGEQPPLEHALPAPEHPHDLPTDMPATPVDHSDPLLAPSAPHETVALAAEPAPAIEGALMQPSVEHVEGEIDGEIAPEAGPPSPEDMSDDEVERRNRSRRRAAILRQYKIQEVIKRNQIILIQVVKEERGNKGAALTTYLSLAGRYCVLMPNTGRGGGVSRKIANPEDRRRMKAIIDDLSVPDGMSVILRTAGMERQRSEIKRDMDYLTRLWDSICEQTMKSSAPALVHEEANLIRRAIRDLYTREIAEIQVEGDSGYRMAKEFMRMMVPSAARRVHHYRDPAVPLFVRHRIETQIEALYTTSVTLKSGGYIVINPTEALVAIDVNSGRSTRERNIEETALRTNLEAADEVGRQLRLRDLAGLIVIDFIDMEDPRHNAMVERRVREAMKADRARVQIGRISMFGLLELSRQRLRPSLVETNFNTCPHCDGTGHMRTVESASLHALRLLEEEGLQQKASELAVTVASSVSLYILNHKRDTLADIERRYGLKVFIHGNDEMKTAEHKIERLKARQPGEFQFPEPPPPIIEEEPPLPEGEEDLGDDLPSQIDNYAADVDGNVAPAEGEETAPRGEGRERTGRSRGGRNRGRGGRGRDRAPRDPAIAADAPQPTLAEVPPEFSTPDYAAANGNGAHPPAGAESEEQSQRRRRGRRGGRGRGRNRAGSDGPNERYGAPGAEQPQVVYNRVDSEPVLTSADLPDRRPVQNNTPPAEKPKTGWWKRLIGSE